MHQSLDCRQPYNRPVQLLPPDLPVLHKWKKIPVPKERLWVNPDCGLKTRGWPETIAALKVMVDVTKKLRAELA